MAKKILSMEDEADISLLAQFTLQSAGYDVRTAGSGIEGFEILKQNGSTDLIILDVMMPGMDGYRVLEKLKSDRGLKDIPVLIFSALVQKKEVEKGYRLGAIGYIKKPFDAENMIHEVERGVSNWRKTSGIDDAG